MFKTTLIHSLRPGSSISQTRLIHISDQAHPYLRPGSSISQTRLIHISDQAHPYLRPGSSITRLIHIQTRLIQRNRNCKPAAHITCKGIRPVRTGKGEHGDRPPPPAGFQLGDYEVHLMELLAIAVYD
ncbi:hypothetical protein DPMN_090550 [Dreissena polymorpha]|uniref:Uncharacterized protein n=1 Tax=Dreissena polymorpha TaxID=45954 RepID=A0A9D4QYB1_DREPO|nr:hypothetical protein DPMN_090550 [Dreissena polymorpha]